MPHNCSKILMGFKEDVDFARFLSTGVYAAYANTQDLSTINRKVQQPRRPRVANPAPQQPASDHNHL